MLLILVIITLLTSIIAMIHSSYQLCLLGSNGDGFNLPAAVVVPLIIIIGMAVGVFATVLTWNVHKLKTRLPVIIKFSVKNEPGSLASALEVFEVRVKENY